MFTLPSIFTIALTRSVYPPPLPLLPTSFPHMDTLFGSSFARRFTAADIPANIPPPLFSAVLFLITPFVIVSPPLPPQKIPPP